MTHETDWIGPGNKSFSITQGKEGGGGGAGGEGFWLCHDKILTWSSHKSL